jgi:hypothetical protein
MLIKVDDDKINSGGTERARAQGAMAAPGLRPDDCDPELVNKRLDFFSQFLWK